LDIYSKINTKEIRQQLINSNDKELIAFEKDITNKDLNLLIKIVRNRQRNKNSNK